MMAQFTQLFDVELKEGIFDGSLIRKMLKDDVFVTKINLTEEKGWLDYKNVVEHFRRSVANNIAVLPSQVNGMQNSM